MKIILVDSSPEKVTTDSPSNRIALRGSPTNTTVLPPQCVNCENKIKCQQCDRIIYCSKLDSLFSVEEKPAKKSPKLYSDFIKNRMNRRGK